MKEQSSNDLPDEWTAWRENSQGQEERPQFDLNGNNPIEFGRKKNKQETNN